MSIKTKKMKILFVEESQIYIKKIYKNTKQLRDKFTLNSISSLLHQVQSYKTTASFMGFKILYALLNGLETLIEAVYYNRIELHSKNLKLIFYTCDMFVLITKNIDEENSDDIPIDVFLDAYNKAINGLPFSFDKIIETLNPQINFNTNNKNSLEKETRIKDIQTIEINIEKVNDLMQDIEKLVLKQYQLKNNVDEIQNEIEKTNSTFLKKIQKQLLDDLNSFSSLISRLQKKVFQLRLVPFETILIHIQKKIELEAKEQNKDIGFHFPQVDILLDKGILELLSDIVYQLLKNTIDHAYETEEKRIQKGKEKQLQVHLNVHTHSDYITIEVKDDGQGVDFETLRFRALDFYPERTKVILEMSEKELMSFLFVSGFTKIDERNYYENQGIGLGIVRKNIDKCKGKISFATEKDIGTQFVLSIPSSLENLKGVFVKAGSFTFLIPIHYISEIYNCEKQDFLFLQNSTMFRLREEIVPVYSLNVLVNEMLESENKDMQVVLVVEYLEKKIGISINELLHTVSAIVKPLPPALQDFPAFQGIVLDETHRFVPVLAIPELINRLELIQPYSLIKAEAKIIKNIKKILVIDNSAITRDIHKSILEAEAYLVDTAEDGIEALTMIKKRHYDIIITDLKMPRMNGYVLIENLKRTKGYEQTPIFIISSLEDESIIEKTMQLGVSSFILKSNFNRETMVDTVKGLVYGTK